MKTLSEIQAEMRELTRLQSEIIKQAVQEASAVQAEIGTRLDGIKPLNPLSFVVAFDGEKVTVSPLNAKRGNSVSANVLNGEKRSKGPVMERHEEIEPQSAYEWIFKGRRVVVERIDDGNGPKKIIIDGDISNVFQSSGTALHKMVTGYNMDGGETLRERGKRIK